MYIPKNMSMEEINDIHRFIQSHSFAIVISQDFHASHIPLILDSEEGELGTLYGHVAKPNLHASTLDKQEVLVIFSGPHAYVSPSWYQQTPAVPTWNYAAVHVKGLVTLTDEAQTLKTLEDTVKYFDPNLKDAEAIMPKAFTQKLSKAIVGFKISIQDIEGKIKLGQHRSAEDQRGVYKNLKQAEDFESLNLASFMERWQIGIGEMNN